MERSLPWDGLTEGDAALAPYSATEWDDIWSSMFGSLGDFGILRGIGGELAVSGAAAPITVATGARDRRVPLRG